MEHTGTLITAGATIIVAVISLIGIMINVWASIKAQKIQDQLNEMREESKAGDKRVQENLEDFMVLEIRAYLIDFMSRMLKGERMNMEQIRIANEKKHLYNKMGKNGYIDDMWENCKKKNLF